MASSTGKTARAFAAAAFMATGITLIVLPDGGEAGTPYATSKDKGHARLFDRVMQITGGVLTAIAGGIFMKGGAAPQPSAPPDRSVQRQLASRRKRNYYVQ